MAKTTGGYCDKCHHYATRLQAIQVSRQTHSEPAEYEGWCLSCLTGPSDELDEAYERAAANFDDSDGRKDWR